MSTFSERYGYTAVRTVLQHEEMDAPLRTDLWNTLNIIIDNSQLYEARDFSPFVQIWMNLWRHPLDEMPYDVTTMSLRVKKHILEGEWYDVYDTIELVVKTLADIDYEKFYNGILERNRAAWRFVDSALVRFDEETDIQAIEQAMKDTTDIMGAKHHLTRALSLLSNRENPDYANSIKESFSAVEAVCQHLSGMKKATLPDGLKALKNRGVSVHPALERSWTAAYGYASDSDGIRHALGDVSNLKRADAQYFLVTTSAFVSLLLHQAVSAGLLDGSSQSRA